MTQMRLQMRPDQTTALGQLATERGVTISELVRQAVDLLLSTETPGEPIALPGTEDAVIELGESAADPLEEAFGEREDAAAEPAS